MEKIALISGVTGQDGSYLADNLLSKNYTVVGLERRTVCDLTAKRANIAKKVINLFHIKI